MVYPSATETFVGRIALQGEPRDRDKAEECQNELRWLVNASSNGRADIPIYQPTDHYTLVCRV